MKTKIALRRLGYYKTPGFGMTPYPDAQLFDAVSDLQRDKGLRRTGEVRPGDDTDKAIRVALAESGKKSGQYIWRTRGDSKVRSEHAERDGKVFEWDNPPEGGHPGEAPNCRCWAMEANKSSDKCRTLKIDIERQIIEVDSLRKELEGFRENYIQQARVFVDTENALFELIAEAAIPDIPDNVGNIREYLKAILKVVGKITMLEELIGAWHERREAMRNMEGAKKIYDDGLRRLEVARKQLSTLREQHHAECS